VEHQATYNDKPLVNENQTIMFVISRSGVVHGKQHAESHTASCRESTLQGYTQNNQFDLFV